MKPSVLKLITFFLISTIFYTYSCRKINDKEPSQIIISDKLEQEFFKVPENISPQLQDVINDIKKQNDQYHFLPKFLQKNGLPVWNKVIANIEGLYPVNNKRITNRFSGRLSSQDSAEVYFIPLIMPDNKIITFLTCVKINNRYSMKVYRRNYLTNLNITTDSVNHYRNAALGIFRYFEKTINNKDTIQVGGVVQQIFSDANIIFNESNSQNKTVELIGSRQLSSITVSYCFGGAQMRLSRNAKVLNTGGGCWSESILVYGSDLGISIISGGYSGDGSGGGGSGGSGTGVVFDCPAGLWWCESGEYRFVDGVLYTSLDYPGKDMGFPWAWWETGSYQTANLPMVFLNLEMLDLILEQAQYLINEPTLNQKLNYYLITDNGQTPEEKKQAAFDHINGLLTNPAYATFVQNYEANDNTGKMWWVNETWLSNPNNFNFDIDYNGQQYDELTVEEKQLVSLYPKQAFIISTNVNEALNRAIILYPSLPALHPGLNDKADAFRHAYFQAMNVRDITPNGISITRAFANAHESEVPVQLLKEKEMDLHNNETGIQVANNQTLNGAFTTNEQFQVLIQAKVSDGSLRYLAPLNHSDIYWYIGPDGTKKTATDGIIPTTQLKPTNQ